MKNKQKQTILAGKVPAGYKQTEVGIIPEDWEVKNIGDVAEFVGGAQPPRSTFISQIKDGYVRLIQIRDYKTSNYETYIPRELAKKTCTSEDIMIGRYGPPIFQILRGLEGAYNVALIKAIPKEHINREYLYFFLKTEKLFHLMDMLSQRSSGQTGVELPALKSYLIPIPPLKEQTTIAEALSDVDSLLVSLEKLIEKKRAIKTGTMQQLLTGKKRLPAFAQREDGTPKGYKMIELGEIPEDWEVKKLSEVCSSFTTGKLDANAMVSDGEYRFYTCAKTYYFIDNYAFDMEALLISGNGANVGYIHYYNGKFNAYQRTYVLSDFKADIKYLKLFLEEQLSERIRVEVNAGNTPYITMDTLTDMLVTLPNQSEQTAIAEILSDMDAEIEALEAKRAKTEKIKQGMMQELLTGRTRLV